MSKIVGCLLTSKRNKRTKRCEYCLTACSHQVSIETLYSLRFHLTKGPSRTKSQIYVVLHALGHVFISLSAHMTRASRTFSFRIFRLLFLTAVSVFNERFTARTIVLHLKCSRSISRQCDVLLAALFALLPGKGNRHLVPWNYCVTPVFLNGSWDYLAAKGNALFVLGRMHNVFVYRKIRSSQ